MAAPRIAKSLDVLRAQVNAKYPNRSKVSDGWIGDAAHAAGSSDHNAASDGAVRALDITHDLAHGLDSWALADIILKKQDRRLYYVISNGRIGSGPRGPQAGVWRKYTGKNAHAHHAHVSVVGNDKSHTAADRALSDDAAPWDIGITGVATPAPMPPKPKGVTEDMRQRMMKVIMAYEGKIPPIVFVAPDGRPEIAGITQKDHPETFDSLKRLLDQGKTAELTAAVLAYYDAYTDPAQNWTDRAGLEFFLRDCILNRGPTGAAEILQLAVTPDEVDHQIGPTTRGALSALDPYVAIDKLRAARERYEDRKYPTRRASGQWQGMLNRWNKAQTQAKAFQREQGTAGLDVAVTTGVIVVSTSTTAAVKQDPWTSADIAMAAFSIGIAALVVFFIVRSLRRRS